MESDVLDPLNIGSSERVSINQLVDMVEEIAGVHLKRIYKLDAPKGVNGRYSDKQQPDEAAPPLGTIYPAARWPCCYL
jgi:hypothetical protein